MITIDGVRYISAKTYSELSGLSLSSISVKKATLPFRHFDEINMDLLNFDLLELAEEVRRNAEQRLATREALPTYTAAQLGEYFIALITRMMNQATSANQLRQEAETTLLMVQLELDESKLKVEDLDGQRIKAVADLAVVETKFGDLTHQLESKLEAANQKINLLSEANQALTTEKNGLSLALETLESIIRRVSSGSVKTVPVQKKAVSKKTGKASKEKA